MTKSFTHYYKGLFGTYPSFCEVKIFSDDGDTFICFTDGEGTSVTNVSEKLASEIVNKENLNPYQCRFFEEYKEYETFDEITYDWIKNGNIWKAFNPFWTPGNEEFKELFNS